jgi:hypothetical protein
VANADDPVSLLERLTRSASILQHAQEGLLDDMVQSCAGEEALITVLRRWEERLTGIKLHLHRCDSHLVSLVERAARMPGPAPALAVAEVDIRLLSRQWRDRLEAFFAQHRTDTTYRRLASPLDLDQEAMNADIVTDLTALVAVMVQTGMALSAFAHARAGAAIGEPSRIEDLVFNQVLLPWQIRGREALIDCLAWLSAMIAELATW